MPSAGPRRISTSSSSSISSPSGSKSQSLPRRIATTRIPTSIGSATSASERLRERAVGADPHAVRDLLGGREIGNERRRDPEPVGDDVRDVDARVAHALDRGEHVQHARHLLGVARRARGEDAHLAHRVREVLQPLFEGLDLVGHPRVAEEQGGIRQVDHELGGVFRLREHGLEIAGLIVGCHQLPAGPVRERITAPYSAGAETGEAVSFPLRNGNDESRAGRSPVQPSPRAFAAAADDELPLVGRSTSWPAGGATSRRSRPRSRSGSTGGSGRSGCRSICSYRSPAPTTTRSVPSNETSGSPTSARWRRASRTGWEPAPLLAQFDRGELLLQDGNHRYEALTRDRVKPTHGCCSGSTTRRTIATSEIGCAPPSREEAAMRDPAPLLPSLPQREPPFPGVARRPRRRRHLPQLLRLSERLAAEGYAVVRARLLLPLRRPRSRRTSWSSSAPSRPSSSKGDLATGIGQLARRRRVVDRRHRLLHGRVVHLPRCVVGEGSRGAGGGAVLRRWDRPRDRRSRVPDAPLLRWARRVHLRRTTSRRSASTTATTSIVYPNAEHGFMRDGSPNYDEASATDAWKRMLAFFGEHLT